MPFSRMRVRRKGVRPIRPGQAGIFEKLLVRLRLPRRSVEADTAAVAPAAGPAMQGAGRALLAAQGAEAGGISLHSGRAIYRPAVRGGQRRARFRP
ncbi:orotidine-5'-phosphate decarboxylase [Amorphus sp. MBR-141]